MEHSSNHPVLEFSNCLSYLLHSRASDARFFKALSVLPTWLTPFVFINACRTSFCCLLTQGWEVKYGHLFHKMLSLHITGHQNSASESSHGTVLGSALNHNVGITAVGVHEVEHVGGLATMATINLFKKTLGAGSPKGARRMSPTALALSHFLQVSLTDERFLTWLLIAHSRLPHKPTHVVGSKNLRAEHFWGLVPGTWFQPLKPHHDYLPGKCQWAKKPSLEKHLITNGT